MDNYKNNGYILHNLLKKSEVDHCRKCILDYYRNKYVSFKESGVQELYAKDAVQIKPVMDIIFSDRVYKSLCEVLGDQYEIFPDFNIHINALYKNGWHVDAGSELNHNSKEIDNLAYLYDESYNQVKCGIYLQENQPNVTGGGVDICQGFHKVFFKKFPAKLRLFIFKCLKKFAQIFCSTHVLNKSGDLLIFNNLLPHKGTHPHKSYFKNSTKAEKDSNILDINRPEIKEDDIKLVIYFQACNRNNSKYLMRNFLQRYSQLKESKKQGNKSTESHWIHWDQTLNLKYPEDFQQKNVNFIKSNRIKIANNIN